MIFLKFNNRDDNYGDQLIFECLYQELVKYDDICFLASAPCYLNTVPVRFRTAFIRALKLRLFKFESSVVIDPPGARFPPRVPEILAQREKIKRWGIRKAWKVIGARYMVTGVSIDPFKNPKDYNIYDSIGVRDNTTYELLKHTHKNVFICPDMACLRVPQLKLDSPVISSTIISLREQTPDDGYSNNYTSDLEAALAEILNTIITDFSFYSQVDEDINYNRDMSDMFSVDYKQGVPENFNYGEFLKDYGMVLSNRLHVLLPAMSEGLLPIVLISSRHTKLKSLFETYGWDDCLVYTDQPNSVADRVRQIIKQADRIRKRNYDSLINLRTEARAYIKDMITHSQTENIRR